MARLVAPHFTLSVAVLLVSLIQLESEAAIPPQVYRIEESPSAWTRQQATRILTDLKSRPQSTAANGPSAETGSGSRAESLSLGITAQRSDWMRFVYKMNWVDRSAANTLLADKLLFFRVAERELGDAVNDYLIPTTGLREFLWEEKLVDQEGRLTSDAVRIEAAVYKRFPTGVLVRPAVGVSSRETGLGLFKDSDEFIAALVNPQSILYQPIHMKKPVRSTVLDLIASGETVVLQADVVRAAYDKVKAAQGSPPKALRWKEVRVHTYSGKVLFDATPHPWLSRHSVTETEVQQAQSLVSEFLGRLPREVVTKQAWSFDVTILADGHFRIAELITNRGKQAAWSSYLDQPNVISAYTAAFEAEAGAKIPGIGGWVARSGFANASDYWSKRFSIWKRQVKATMIAK